MAVLRRRGSEPAAAPAAAAAAPAKAAPAKARPFDVAAHARALFVPRASGGGAFRPLDGLRACLCLWMVVFHTACYVHYFLTDEQTGELTRGPVMRAVMLGYLPVDGFLMLSGFLIAYPLVSAGARGRPPMPPGGVAELWYRRLARMLPVYYLGIAIFALANARGQFPIEQIRSEAELRMAFKYDFGDAWPSGCDDGVWLASALFTNNMVPFGGCQGYTWSLAVQFQFYLGFPLLWAWLVRSGRTHLLPRIALGAAAAGVAWRALTFVHLLGHDPTTIEGAFFSFFWYSHTFNRSPALFLGVALAWAHHDGRLAAWFRRRACAQAALLAVAAAGPALQIASAVLLDRGEGGLNVPDRVILEMAREAGGGDSALAALPHAAYHVMVWVGGPLSCFVFCYAVFVSLGGVGAPGRALARVWSWPVWHPVAQLSYWVYLLHPLVIIKLSSHVFYPLSHAPAAFCTYVAAVLGVTFALAAALHVLFERPADALLRGGAPGKGALRAVRWFVYACLALSALHHAFMTGAVLVSPGAGAAEEA